MSDQAQKRVETDPVRELENTRRTLLKLVANINAVIAACKDPATSR